MNKGVRGLVPLLAALCVAGPAAAQSASGRGAPTGGPPSLPELLQLRPSQDAAWRAYRDELAQERADSAHMRGEVDQLNALATPQRLDRMLAQLPAREAESRRHAAAAKAFYAALTPDQRATYDRVTRLPTPRPPPPANPPGGVYSSTSTSPSRGQRPPPPPPPIR